MIVEEGHEGDQRRDADDDARHQDGDVDQRVEGVAEPAAHALEAECRKRSDDGGECRGGERYHQAGGQRFGDQRIGEGLAIPFQREALPDHRLLSGIEGAADDEGDGRIEEDVDEDGVEAHG